MSNSSDVNDRSVPASQATVIPEWELENGYYMRILQRFEEPLVRQLIHDIHFKQMGGVDIDSILTPEEIASKHSLEEKLSSPFRIRVGVFHGEKLVGWSLGWQESEANFFMANLGILPDHRNDTLYSQLISKVIEVASSKGFQVITSKHVAVNNAVIIEKLKAGFVITGIELSDLYGTLVRLSYYTNEARKHLLNVRAGFQRPDEKTKSVLF
jgi:ribosomal protein S18 acetylase RimI-like enzyme